MVQVAALLFALICIAVCLFQVALIFGAPWGELTLGGRWPGPLPMLGRILAGASIALLLTFAAIIVSRAGLAFQSLQAFAPSLSWVVVGYCALGSVANAATPSRRERAIWLPSVLCMLFLSTLVALS